MPLDRRAIGAKISAWRKAKKISQTELAQQIGVNRSTLSLWESGKQLPQPAQLCSLAQYMGVPTEALAASRKGAKTIAREVVANMHGIKAQEGLKILFDDSNTIEALCEALGRLSQTTPASDAEALQLGKAYLAFGEIINNALADRDTERGEAEGE